MQKLPSDNIMCGKEGGSCVVRSGQTLYYGANGVFLPKSNVIGTIECGSTPFGYDPLVGINKACYASPAPIFNDSNLCEIEGGICRNVKSDEVIYYGINDKYYSKAGNDSDVRCSNEIFGDPNPGYVKSCYVKKLLSNDQVYYGTEGLYSSK